MSFALDASKVGIKLKVCKETEALDDIKNTKGQLTLTEKKIYLGLGTKSITYGGILDEDIQKIEEKITALGKVWRIKGKVADKTALDAIQGMSEGDAYLLNSGELYLYADFEASGTAKWEFICDTTPDVANFVLPDQDNTFTGNNTFNNAVKVGEPTEDTHAVTKKYVDDGLNLIAPVFLVAELDALAQ